MSISNERSLDHTGQNLIRIVIGSYFMAIALGLISGFDQSAMFLSSMDQANAELVGTAILFISATAFMSGLQLRITSLVLALFVLCSSVIENYMQYENVLVSTFWRDLVLASAVLLSYSSLRRRDLRKASLILRHSSHRIVAGGGDIAPRRVTPSTKPTRRPADTDYERVLRPLIAPTQPIIKADRDEPLSQLAPYTSVSRRATRNLEKFAVSDPEDDCRNIFSDL